MTEEDKIAFEEVTHCHICENELNEDKVIDHDHLTGKYRGAAHNECNLNYKLPKHFHNLSGYDAHLFIAKLGVNEGKIDCIPNNEEKYISFKKRIEVDEFTNKEGKLIKIYREIRFIDSFKFMASSLDSLVSNLERDQFKILNSKFEGEKLNLLLKKGVYPYDYMNSFEKFEEMALPPKNEFYSKLYS